MPLGLVFGAGLYEKEHVIVRLIIRVFLSHAKFATFAKFYGDGFVTTENTETVFARH